MVNPDTIKAQMEGGIVYGLTAALKGEITIKDGRVVQKPLRRLPDDAHQRDAGDRGVHRAEHRRRPAASASRAPRVAAGSLVNAIFAATGKRIYKLPIKPEQLRGGTA